MPENGEPEPLHENMPNPSEPDHDPRSRVLVYGFGIMVAAIFLVACLLTTPFGDFGTSNQDSLSESEVRQIVEEAVGTQIALVPPGGAGVSEAQIQQMVNDAVSTQVMALVPTNTPIPPTPTIIPRDVIEDDDPSLGPDSAPVVIVEFSDFQCGFCGRWYKETLPKILETYPEDVKFVYRDFTIFGEESVRAATAAECANEQGQFWEMHNRLFDRLLNQEDSPLNDETFISYAQELGLDTSAFSECLTSQRYYEEVLNDYQAAENYGLRGTPGFVIDGVVYAIGAQPFEVFNSIIQSELAKLQDEG
jgi:protein-disulfide isomerase